MSSAPPTRRPTRLPPDSPAPGAAAPTAPATWPRVSSRTPSRLPTRAPSRRTFLKVMGASAALAGVTGCRRPVETILPYARKPEEVIPGISSYYATSMTLGGVGHAVLVQSNEGRPTKVEGNPEHPVSQGATDIFTQASVLQLYDPDRSRHVVTRGDDAPVRTDWGSFVAEAGRLRQRGGRVVVLAEPSASPTVNALRDRYVAATGAQWITLGAHLDDAQALGHAAGAGPAGSPAAPLLGRRRDRLARRRLPGRRGPELGLEQPRVRRLPARRRARLHVAALRHRVDDDHDGRHGRPPTGAQGRRGPVCGCRHRPGSGCGNRRSQRDRRRPRSRSSTPSCRTCRRQTAARCLWRA